MSKIICLAVPTEGHFSPFVPIVSNFVRSGHNVLFITGRNLQDRVKKTGAKFMPLPEKWDLGDKELYDMFPDLKAQKGLTQIKTYIKQTMLDPAIDVLNELKKILVNFPADIIMNDTFSIAGTLLHESGGPPNVMLSVLPLHLPGKNLAPYGSGLLPGKGIFSKLRNNLLRLLLDNFLFKDILDHANELRRQLGLPAYQKNFINEGFLNNHFIFQLSIPEFEYSQVDLPHNFRFIGPVLIPPVENYDEPDWWDEIEKDIPVILINQGTIAKNYDDLILPAIEALKDENMILIAVPVRKGEIDNLPGNTHAEPFIPFGNLLPHIDLMITNGGFGGTQNALAHGIPVIVAGATEDKMEVAARVVNSGAGINLRKQKPRPGDIKSAVSKILANPSYRQNAQKLKSIYENYDAPALAVRLIEELIEKANKQ